MVHKAHLETKVQRVHRDNLVQLDDLENKVLKAREEKEVNKVKLANLEKEVREVSPDHWEDQDHLDNQDLRVKPVPKANVVAQDLRDREVTLEDKAHRERLVKEVLLEKVVDLDNLDLLDSQENVENLVNLDHQGVMHKQVCMTWKEINLFVISSEDGKYAQQ